MELSKLGKVIETDVLILGAGTAGCGAALAARDQGVRALIVDKGSIEACGQAGPGMGGYNTYLDSGPDWDTAEAIANYYVAGREAMMAALSTELYLSGVARWMVYMKDRLEGAGVKFERDPQDPSGYYRGRFLGRPGAWGLWLENGRAVGAVGFHIWTGDFYIFRAKSAVLALATTNARVATDWAGNPFNCQGSPYNTGSGPAMAYDAGAKLVGLERASANIITVGVGGSGLAAWTSAGGHFVNAKGERFLEKYDSRAEGMPRHRIWLAIFEEQMAGNLPIYMDVRHASAETIATLKHHLFSENVYEDYFAQRGIDPQHDLVEMSLEGMRGAGSLLVNDRFESSLKGLFGYTPATLSGSLCGGYSSATEAAEEARNIKDLPEIDANQVAEEQERVLAPSRNTAGYHWREYEDLVRRVMRRYVGVKRSKESMEAGLTKLKAVEEHAYEIKANNPHELMRAHEAVHLLKLCQLTTRAALARKESGRGVYIRSDYPDRAEEWAKKWVVMWQEGGEPKVSVEEAH
ncbi:FAD-binding protein [Chloroflexota bacterium]